MSGLRGPLRRPGGPTRRLGRLGLAGAAAAGLALLGGPVLGLTGQAALAAGQAAPDAPAACSPGALTASGAYGQIAGYTLDGLAAGLRYQLDSPGLLPVGNPAKGNITSLDVPFARETITEGLVASRSSVAYPGDTAAGLGSALGEFGLNGVPNDPVLANAAYPTAPGAPARSSYPPGGEPEAANAGEAVASAGPTEGSSAASVASFSLGTGSAVLARGGPARSSSVAHIGTACVDSTATASAQDLVIAGLIHIRGVSSVAAARSDGSKAVPYAALRVGRVTVDGLGAYIDHNGIHLDKQQPVGAGVVQAVQSELDSALAADGLEVSLLTPVTSTEGAGTTIDTGGVELTLKTEVPATGVPGVPALTIPGQPPIPLGTPGAPVEYQLVFGAARITVDATRTPPLGAPTLSAGGLGAGPIGTPSGGPAGSSTAGGAFPGPASSRGVGGPAAAPAVAAGMPPSRPTGAAVPVAWVVVGALASLAAAAPLLAAARWQLLEGRLP